MNRLATSVIVLTALAVFPGCRRVVVQTSAPFNVNIYTGSVSVTEADARKLRGAKDISYNTMNRILFALDSRDPKSDISRVNGIAGSTRWPIPNDTFRLLDLINHYSTLTDGAIDITMGPIAELWGIGADEPHSEPPPTELVKATLQGVGQSHIKLSDDGTIAFYSPLIRLDIGSLAAGYAVDLSILNLRRQGITNLLLTLDQSSRALGFAKPDELWSVPLPDPWGATQSLGTVQLAGRSALTIARLYEKTFVVGELTNSCILNPKTGMPAEGTAMAAVIAPSATMASSLAHALLISGLEKAEDILAAFPRCEALVVPDVTPLEMWATKSFAATFTAQPEIASNLRILNVSTNIAGESGPAADEPVTDSSSNP